jgi:hypothetical protein
MPWQGNPEWVTKGLRGAADDEERADSRELALRVAERDDDIARYCYSVRIA